MNTPDQNDVSTALGLLRDSLAEEEQRIRSEGASAMQAGDYDTATLATAAAQRANLERKLAAKKETAR
jgi:protein-tyrosine-phosphatase